MLRLLLLLLLLLLLRRHGGQLWQQAASAQVRGAGGLLVDEHVQARLLPLLQARVFLFSAGALTACSALCWATTLLTFRT